MPRIRRQAAQAATFPQRSARTNGRAVLLAPGSLSPCKDHHQGRTSSLRCGRSTLTLIFPGKPSAPIGRTDPTRLELQGGVARSEDNRPVPAVPLRAIQGHWSHASDSCGRASGARRKERRRKRHVRLGRMRKVGVAEPIRLSGRCVRVSVTPAAGFSRGQDSDAGHTYRCQRQDYSAALPCLSRQLGLSPDLTPVLRPRSLGPRVLRNPAGFAHTLFHPAPGFLSTTKAGCLAAAHEINDAMSTAPHEQLRQASIALPVGACRGSLAIGLRWPDFGRTTALNAAACCALLSSISAGQLMYGLVVDAPATLYGSDAWYWCNGPAPAPAPDRRTGGVANRHVEEPLLTIETVIVSRCIGEVSSATYTNAPKGDRRHRSRSPFERWYLKCCVLIAHAADRQ